jgi:hypothetical protein
MSFLDYLDEHRGEFIDHRASVPLHQGMSAQEAEDIGGHDAGPTSVEGGGGPSRSRRRRARQQARGIRFRHVRPAFSPSPYSDPLPYEEPWERAFR